MDQAQVGAAFSRGEGHVLVAAAAGFEVEVVLFPPGEGDEVAVHFTDRFENQGSAVAESVDFEVAPPAPGVVLHLVGEGDGADVACGQKDGEDLPLHYIPDHLIPLASSMR